MEYVFDCPPKRLWINDEVKQTDRLTTLKQNGEKLFMIKKVLLIHCESKIYSHIVAVAYSETDSRKF